MAFIKTGFSAPEELLNKAKALAEKRNKTVSGLVCDLLTKEIDRIDMQDTVALKLSEALEAGIDVDELLSSALEKRALERATA